MLASEDRKQMSKTKGKERDFEIQETVICSSQIWTLGIDSPELRRRPRVKAVVDRSIAQYDPRIDIAATPEFTSSTIVRAAS